ncbi:DUF3106 domain-containing protein [Lysobacter fragariae]
MNIPCRFLLPALLCATPAFAQQPSATPARSFPAWEQLSAAERNLLVAPVRERWNANPAARARMLEHARRWQLMTPDQRQKAHRGAKRWERMNPEQREHMRALFAKMRTMTPEQRRALREQWRAMTPEQKDAWMQRNAPKN